MESSIERIGPVECRVKVEIPWTDVSPRLDTKLRDLRSRARVPGFRPGKVPPQVIERMFGKSIRDELARDLVNETFQTAVTQHETVPLTQPVLEESSLDRGQPFTYAARFEVPPAIVPKDYEGVEVRRRPSVVDEAKVDAELERKRSELVEMRPLPEDEKRTATQALDVWTVDIDGTLGEQRVNRKDLQVEIGAEAGEFIPGLGKAMESLELADVGSSKTFEFTPPEERVRPELRGQVAKLTAGLREVRVKYVPPLDDDFARDTGDAESLAELKTKVSDKIREADAEEAEREARRRLVEALLERNEFEPAPSMVAREVSAQVDMTKRQLAQQGMRLSNIGTTENQLAQRIRPQAVFNVKAYLLLDAIGKAHEIEVSDEEFEAELTTMAEDSGQNVARMKATMEKNGQLVLMRAQMREEKILDLLMSKAKVTEAPDPEPEPDDTAAG
jgi:trigger factor